MKSIVPRFVRSEKIRPFEKLLVDLETPPWGAMYRIAIGVAIPSISRLWGRNVSGWMLAPFLIVVLLTLRAVPAVIRKFVPFSDAVQAVWAERRQIAKRWDSYQWQKLLWFGTGLTLSTTLSGQYSTSRIAICTFSMVAGALGVARWQFVCGQTKSAQPPAKPARDLARQT